MSTTYSVEWIGKDGNIYYSEVTPDGAGPVQSPQKTSNFVPPQQGVLGLCVVVSEIGTTTVYKRIAEVGPNTVETSAMDPDQLAEEFLSEPGLYQMIERMHEAAEQMAEDMGSELGTTIQ